ncbi:MAG: hypothetical protein J1F06_02265, partial [Prevotellaceae bacterium]|nr:hypothetical protein [Prevotellaceae bacterium]
MGISDYRKNYYTSRKRNYFAGKKAMFSIFQYFCQRNKNTGCSAVRLAHLLWEQGVVGSNP